MAMTQTSRLTFALFSAVDGKLYLKKIIRITFYTRPHQRFEHSQFRDAVFTIRSLDEISQFVDKKSEFTTNN